MTSLQRGFGEASAELRALRTEFLRVARHKRVAVVHDQLYTLGGAEKVLKSILDLFPDADVYALFDLLEEKDRVALVGEKPIHTSIMQRMPLLRKLRKIYFPVMPFAIEQFDLGKYDLLVSSSYLVAKGILVAPDQLHACYMHSPMRYVWDQRENYVEQIPSRFGVRKMLIRMMLHYVRGWDTRSTNGVDLLLVNSHYVARRAMKAYRRPAEVLYPPVDIDKFRRLKDAPVDEATFVTMSRLVEGKRVHLLLQAFRELPDCRLVVIGDGPMRATLEASAPPNVTFAGRLTDDAAVAAISGASGFVYAAEEDFGIAPVEAQACGTPVVAFGRGGTGETVRDLRTDPGAPTGVLFDEATPEGIAAAVRLLRENRSRFRAEDCRANAERFAHETFERNFMQALLRLFESQADGTPRPSTTRPSAAPISIVSATGRST